MANALPFMSCQNRRLINGSDGETGTDFATVNQAGLLGWNSVGDTWAYASASTITVPTDATLKYAVGDRVRLKQGGGYKYFYIVIVAATLLTVTGGSDYTVANSAITDVAVSKHVNPFGFPGAFNWTPTLTGFSANPTSTIYRFSVTGRRCFVDVTQNTAGTSNATTFKLSIPVSPASVTNEAWIGSAQVVNNGVLLTTPGLVAVVAGGTTIDLYIDYAANVWAAANGKKATFQVSYEI